MARSREAPWRCSECGIALEEADARRRRRGLQPVRILAWKVCSPECSLARRDRLQVVLNSRAPKPATWSCSSCGCSLRKANRRRWNQDLQPLPAMRPGKLCTPDCPERVAMLGSQPMLRKRR